MGRAVTSTTRTTTKLACPSALPALVRERAMTSSMEHLDIFGIRPPRREAPPRTHLGGAGLPTASPRGARALLTRSYGGLMHHAPHWNVGMSTCGTRRHRPSRSVRCPRIVVTMPARRAETAPKPAPTPRFGKRRHMVRRRTRHRCPRRARRGACSQWATSVDQCRYAPPHEHGAHDAKPPSCSGPIAQTAIPAAGRSRTYVAT
jgi:hypothetical protein